jgi:hypothetical protein
MGLFHLFRGFVVLVSWTYAQHETWSLCRDMTPQNKNDDKEVTVFIGPIERWQSEHSLPLNWLRVEAEVWWNEPNCALPPFVNAWLVDTYIWISMQTNRFQVFGCLCALFFTGKNFSLFQNKTPRPMIGESNLVFHGPSSRWPTLYCDIDTISIPQIVTMPIRELSYLNTSLEESYSENRMSGAHQTTTANELLWMESTYRESQYEVQGGLRPFPVEVHVVHRQPNEQVLLTSVFQSQPLELNPATNLEMQTLNNTAFWTEVLLLLADDRTHPDSKKPASDKLSLSVFELSAGPLDSETSTNLCESSPWSSSKLFNHHITRAVGSTMLIDVQSESSNRNCNEPLELTLSTSTAFIGVCFDTFAHQRLERSTTSSAWFLQGAWLKTDLTDSSIVNFDCMSNSTSVYTKVWLPVNDRMIQFGIVEVLQSLIQTQEHYLQTTSSMWLGTTDDVLLQRGVELAFGGSVISLLLLTLVLLWCSSNLTRLRLSERLFKRDCRQCILDQRVFEQRVRKTGWCRVLGQKTDPSSTKPFRRALLPMEAVEEDSTDEESRPNRKQMRSFTTLCAGCNLRLDVTTWVEYHQTAICYYSDCQDQESSLQVSGVPTHRHSCYRCVTAKRFRVCKDCSRVEMDLFSAAKQFLKSEDAMDEQQNFVVSPLHRKPSNYLFYVPDRSGDNSDSVELP